MLGQEICDICFPDDVKRNRQPRLVLLECHEEHPNSVLGPVESQANQKFSEYYLALFNVRDGLGIEERCVWLGVRGVFYNHDSLPQFLKGVRAILSGQLWLSRQVMSRCILENGGKDSPSKTDSSVLTPREAEILAPLAVGATNDEIADKLCISPHTVKTHLYNIYQKINVPNRLQAALWTTKNL